MKIDASTDKGKRFLGEDIHPWSINICPMSSEAFAEAPGGDVLAAWDTKGQVYFARIDRCYVADWPGLTRCVEVEELCAAVSCFLAAAFPEGHDRARFLQPGEY